MWRVPHGRDTERGILELCRGMFSRYVHAVHARLHLTQLTEVTTRNASENGGLGPQEAEKVYC